MGHVQPCQKGRSTLAERKGLSAYQSLSSKDRCCTELDSGRLGGNTQSDLLEFK